MNPIRIERRFEDICIHEAQYDVFGNLVRLLSNMTYAIHNRHLALAVRIRTTKQIEPRAKQSKIESSATAIDLDGSLSMLHFSFE